VIMWQCYECGEEFEVPTMLASFTGCPDEPDDECCPNCGSDDINEL
jgi:hypothetical protein